MSSGEKTTGHEKCRACTHYILQWSFLLEAYVEGCDAGESCSFENKKKKLKEKQKAFIKVKGAGK